MYVFHFDSVMSLYLLSNSVGLICTFETNVLDWDGGLTIIQDLLFHWNQAGLIVPLTSQQWSIFMRVVRRRPLYSGNHLLVLACSFSACRGNAELSHIMKLVIKPLCSVTISWVRTITATLIQTFWFKECLLCVCVCVYYSQNVSAVLALMRPNGPSVTK